MAKVLKEHVSDAIFDAISLYCVENGFHDSLKTLTHDKLKPIQAEVEKLLSEMGHKIE